MSNRTILAWCLVLLGLACFVCGPWLVKPVLKLLIGKESFGGVLDQPIIRTTLGGGAIIGPLEVMVPIIVLVLLGLCISLLGVLMLVRIYKIQEPKN